MNKTLNVYNITVVDPETQKDEAIDFVKFEEVKDLADENATAQAFVQEIIKVFKTWGRAKNSLENATSARFQIQKAITDFIK